MLLNYLELVDRLDKRICDCEDCNNTYTYREYIRKVEREFSLEEADIDSMDNETLVGYVDYLDHLESKGNFLK